MQDGGKSEITANIYFIAAKKIIMNLIDDTNGRRQYQQNHYELN